MSRISIAIAAALLLLGQTAAPLSSGAIAAAPPVASSGGTDSCQALAATDFSGVTDAPTTIMWTKAKAAAADLPAHCEVRGYATPNIGFLAWLPQKSWNGKFLEGGCGGTCGSLDGIAQCRDPLRRGYACIVSDGGHSSGPLEMKWAYQRPETMVDYYVRTPHVTAAIGKALVKQYYSEKPSRSYFLGCSSGGTQALGTAQFHPWDFDGIISIAAAPSLGDTMTGFIWGYQTLFDKAGKFRFPQDKLELLHDAVVARCDRNDGVKDGLIGNPLRCTFKPEEIQCKPGTSGQCLSPDLVAIANRLYNGPRTPDGQQIAPPQSTRGTELTWPLYADMPGGPSDFIADWFRYYAMQPNPGPKWTMADFDFASDYARGGAGSIVDPSNPDLSRFAGAGGKMLMVSGWHDGFVSVPRLAQYYDKVEGVMGGRAKTQGFLRAFFSPGMGHCWGGPGANSIDYLTYLENWVEKGEAPDKLMAYHLTDVPTEWNYEDFPIKPGAAKFSRPIYPWPVEARYLGRGDPNDGANFGPDASALKAPR